MGTNDSIILDQVLEQQRKDLASQLDAQTYFELFCFEQILKDFDLSYEEIQSGMVGGGGDGGIDGFYVFVNGEILLEDSDPPELQKNVHIEVYLIQAKTSTGFSESAMDKFVSSTEDLFDLTKPLASMNAVYNDSLLKAADRFRTAFQNLASKFPRLQIHYFYASKGDQVHPNVSRKQDRLRLAVQKLFSSAEFDLQFQGSRQLLDLARRTPTTSYQLKLSESPISSGDDGAFICLVSLGDFVKFITDERGQLVRHIFEANVRDYQGRNQVNEQIQDTLRNPGTEDFWWLNNGVTVLATRAVQSGKTLTIENPEIVNGLQTSTEIQAYYGSCNTQSEKRNVLVRVLVPNAAESRDRIIKATNSQTAIPLASLRATDRIHRDIEEYLKTFGLYYDRRKNFYKNEKKPISRIVGIPQLAQAVMSVHLSRPDTARARPSSLLKTDEEYQKLFDSNFPIELYRACIEVVRQSEAYLANNHASLEIAHRNNIKYYLAMTAAKLTLKISNPTARDVASLAGKTIIDSTFDDAYRIARDNYDLLGGDDQTAKGSKMLIYVNLKIEEVLSQG